MLRCWLGELVRRRKRTRTAPRSRTSPLWKALHMQQLEDRQMLAAVSWNGGATGNWDVAANWSNNAVPTSTADVTISTTGSATVTIKSGDAESVHSLVIGSNDSLSFTGGSLTVAAGLTSGGTITVGPTST